MKNIFTFISLLFVLVLIIFAISSGKNQSNSDVKAQIDSKVVIIENDVQIINITSTSGGYTPNTIIADANIQTILRMNSKNSYGCERSFRIPSMGINQVLPQEGITEFDLGVPQNGQEVFGSCSMGMYTFTITFE